MSILVKIVDSRLEYSNETFSENNTIIQIYLCTVMKDANDKESETVEFLADIV